MVVVVGVLFEDFDQILQARPLALDCPVAVNVGNYLDVNTTQVA